VGMLKDTDAPTVSQFLTGSFSRVSPAVARRICEAAKIGTRARPTRIGRQQADALYHAIQQTKISNPQTDCITPIGEELILKGLHQVVPGEFFAAATRPPSVYRGNPFAIEVGLAYGGGPSVHRVTREGLVEMIEESDARTLRQFLTTTFDGLGSDGADRIIKEAKLKTRSSPSRLSNKEIDHLLDAMRHVNVSEGQSMNVLRYANRVPLQFQAGGCAVTQTVMQTNWRAYGLTQSRGQPPRGPVTVMVHVASVWVPFTSESKEAIAAYPEIQKELRLALQTVGRKLGMYLRRRKIVRHQGERRSIFLRYLKEVAGAVSRINQTDDAQLYEKLLAVAKKRTSEADMQLDESGQFVEDNGQDLGDNVLVVPADPPKAHADATED